MTQEVFWQSEPTYTLAELEMFNWGGFVGHHRAQIDPAGTAVIGPTGSGKTTLVDALMTLLTANPKYNLASTGGHESDRDLVSYVRGVSGPGDGGIDQSHIARPGRTVTGIAATLHNGDEIARLGVLLWFDDTSSSPTDMKKLWIFSTVPQQTLEQWLTIQHGGGMRALRQLDKTETGIWTYPSKKAFLARIRDFFEVRENAFNLLNRAAGLKQLNSIDEIFRDLVLDDTSQFERAKEVAETFDDLTAIHEELEVARRQQRSLEPVKTAWEKYQQNEVALNEKSMLNSLLPIWFGEQAYQLWKEEWERLTTECQQAEASRKNAAERYSSQEKMRDNLKEAYLRLGGSDIQVLEELIQAKQQNLQRVERSAQQYQDLVQRLALPIELTRQTFASNQEVAKQQLQEMEQKISAAEQLAFEQGSSESEARRNLQSLNDELRDVQQRPESNIRRDYQNFRTALAEKLNLSEDNLPFVAELVQVKQEEHAWRGAIERAIGSHRLRIMVPSASAEAALRWINDRDNQLHVRVLEVKQQEVKQQDAKRQDHQPQFMEDGFTRKLDYKPHLYRETVKQLLAGIDRHCVTSPEQLRNIEHAMTMQGLMSGKARFYDKQDHKRLADEKLTGFDNRDRLAFLQQQIIEATSHQKALGAQLEKAKAKLTSFKQQYVLLEQLEVLDFDQINTELAVRELNDQQEKLRLLTAPDSDIAAAKQSLEEAERVLKILDQERAACIQKLAEIKKDQQLAEQQKSKAFRKAEAGLNEEQRQLAQRNFPPVTPEQLHEILDLERQALADLQSLLDTLKDKRARLGKDLTRCMSDAQREDRGALSEVGRELEDVPQYIDRLKQLTEEALPEKRQRFKDYLNRSSDEGVTQLLMTIDNEVERIEEKLDDVNSTLRRVDFQSGRYLQLISSKVIHESLRSFQAARAKLASARFMDDDGESQYKALQHIVALLRDACERNRTLGAKALLDPRFRLEFKVSVIERASGTVIETRSGSQGGSGGEKEIIASYVLTASLSYALCPDGSSRPLFGTIVLDEAFSRSSHAVAGRIIAALKEFGLHALFITPNKEMRLLRNHTRSAIVVHRRGMVSTLAALSWQELDAFHLQRSEKNP